MKVKRKTAGVKYSDKGITVDHELRTSVRHIYAAGDVLGGYEFSHFAGWQAFQAVRNALLPGHSSGQTDSQSAFSMESFAINQNLGWIS